MVEREHRDELAIRPALDAALADLPDNVVVVPCQLVGHAPHGRPVELPLSRVGGVTRRSPHRPAGVGIGAIPHDPARPRRHLLLADGDGRHWWRPLTPADRRRRRIGPRQPRLHDGVVDACRVQLGDADGPQRHALPSRSRPRRPATARCPPHALWHAVDVALGARHRRRERRLRRLPASRLTAWAPAPQPSAVQHSLPRSRPPTRLHARGWIAGHRRDDQLCPRRRLQPAVRREPDRQLAGCRTRRRHRRAEGRAVSEPP